jgi:hypothetical protein
MENTMEKPMVFDQRLSLVVAGTAWFSALMCMMAWGLNAH